MKVPTYQRQVTATREVAAQRLSVQASPSALSAPDRAAEEAFGQASRTAFNFAEREIKLRNQTQVTQAQNYAHKALSEAQFEAESMQPDEAENFMAGRIEAIRAESSELISNDLVKQQFGLKFDPMSLGYNNDVRRYARRKRFDIGRSEWMARRDQLQTDALSQDPTKRAKAMNELFGDTRSKAGKPSWFAIGADAGYFTATEAMNERIKAEDFVEKEQIIGSIRGMDLAGLEALEERLESGEFDITETTRAALMNKVEASISDIEKVSDEESRTALNQIRLTIAERTIAGKPMSIDELRELGDANGVALGITDEADQLALAVTIKSEIAARISDQNAQGRALVKQGKTFRDILLDGGSPGLETLESFNQIAMNSGSTGQEALDYNQETIRLLKIIDPLRSQNPIAVRQYLNSIAEGMPGAGGKGRDTEFEVLAYNSVEKLLTNMNTKLDKDGLAYAAQSGVVQTSFLQFGDIENLPGQIIERQNAVDVAENRFGRSINFLHAEEISSLKDTYDQAPPKARTQLAEALRGLPAESLKKIAGAGAPLLAISATLPTELSDAIFRGQSKLDAGQPKVSGNKPEAVFQAHISQVFTNPRDQEALRKSAFALYADRRTQFDEFDEDEFAEILQTLSPISEFNGARYELPQGVDGETFNNYIRELTADDVTTMLNGDRLANYTEEQLLQDVSDGNLLLKSYGQNRYALVNVQGQPVTAFESEGELPGTRVFTVTYDPDIKKEQTKRSEALAESRRFSVTAQETAGGLDQEAIAEQGQTRVRRTERIAEREARLKARRDALNNRGGE